MSSNLLSRVLARLQLVRTRLSGKTEIQRFGFPERAPKRIMYVTNSFSPTLQLSFVKPLQLLVDDGEIAAELLSEQQLNALFWDQHGERAAQWVRRRLDGFAPHVIVLCRYSGPHVQLILKWAQTHGVASVFHIDDDLLNVPREIGQAKFEFHNHPARTGAIEYQLRHADLVYCSTQPLLERFRAQGLVDGRGLAGSIYCSGEIQCEPPSSDTLVIGYMGFDHAHDFELVLPALVRLMDTNVQVQFELFGSIPKPAALERFGTRVRTVPPVQGYGAFMAKFVSLGWSIGICPLADTAFNRVKANTKWVEYTAIGAAVVASAGTIYDSCCADGCGLLVRGDAGWEQALQSLVEDAALRQSLVRSAQHRVASEYSVAALREQVLAVLQQSGERVGKLGSAVT